MFGEFCKEYMVTSKKRIGSLGGNYSRGLRRYFCKPPLGSTMSVNGAVES